MNLVYWNQENSVKKYLFHESRRKDNKIFIVIFMDFLSFKITTNFPAAGCR